MIEKSEDISAIAMSCVNLAVSLCVPGIGPFISIVSPLLQRIFGRAFLMVAKGNVSEVGRARLGVTYMTVAKEYNSRECKVEEINSLFLPSVEPSFYTKADEIIESTLWSVVFDSESEKSVVYGQFLSRIPFLERPDFTRLVELGSILKQLTFEEIHLLQSLGDKTVHNYSSLELSVHQGTSMDNAYQYGRLLHLKSLGLLIQQAPFVVGTSLGNVKITSLGTDLLDSIG